MKLTILGAGTGVSGLPNAAQFPPGFLVEWGAGGPNEKILFECTEGVRFRLEKAGYEYTDIHHVAISHAHNDHYNLLPYLQAVYGKGPWGGEKFVNKSIDIYAPAFITENFLPMLKMHWQKEDAPIFKWIAAVHMHATPQENNFQIGSAKLSAAKVYHEAGLCDAVAFRLETPEGIFAYSGDTGECEGIHEIAKNADVFVCEASAYIGDDAAATGWGHLNPRQIGEIAKSAGVKKVIFFHYTGHDSHQAMIDDCRASGFAGEIVVGEDFQVVKF